MSQLEEQSGPVLTFMGRDLALSLSMDNQALISAWALKTAMVWEYSSPADRRLYYLDGDRERMRASRAIPENTTVWLARYGGTPMLLSSAADATDDPTRPNADTTFRAWVTELVFGHLAVQVLSFRSLMVDSPLVSNPVPGPWEECAIRVWPPTTGGVDWPPRLTLDREIPFEVFRRRWPRLPPPSD